MTFSIRVRRLASHPRTFRYGFSRLLDPLVFALFARERPDLASVITMVQKRHLTYLHRESLMELAKAVLSIDRAGTSGAVVEAGTALGGSAIVLTTAKHQSRPMKIYDAFGMIPAPSDSDGADAHERYRVIAEGTSSGIGGDLYYGYRQDLLAEVVETFSQFGLSTDAENIEFVKGLYEDKLRVDYPVALAHLDCDWYDSLMVCLERIEPHLVTGGRFVIDDYYTFSGCARAVDEFFAERMPDYQFVHKSRLHIIRTG